MPHSRFYGTFAKIIARYVHDERLIPPEQAVCKMTGGPAKALKLRDRGLLNVGHCADIVIFDPWWKSQRKPSASISSPGKSDAMPLTTIDDGVKLY
jgi:N-acyl-D-aspartate/D-glutamate deacylase